MKDYYSRERDFMLFLLNIALFVLILISIFNGCTNPKVGTMVMNNNTEDRNFGEVGEVHSVHQNHWGNDSWALVAYDTTGGLKGEYLHDLIKVEEK